jgi:hypothetical protein
MTADPNACRPSFLAASIMHLPAITSPTSISPDHDRPRSNGTRRLDPVVAGEQDLVARLVVRLAIMNADEPGRRRASRLKATVKIIAKPMFARPTARLHHRLHRVLHARWPHADADSDAGADADADADTGDGAANANPLSEANADADAVASQ